MHLDDEVARILGRLGVSEGFLARSRPGSGLRLLDARHRVMAEFSRDYKAGVHGFPQANMFHQPDLEELLLARVAEQPLIDFRRGAEVCGIEGTASPLTAAPVRVRTLVDEEPQTFTGTVVLGCDGANSTIRELAGIPMEDLGFTERWLVVDIRVEGGLDTWDGVEQICDPARAATFMQVTGDRYRWEFRLRDGEDEACLTTPQALGALLRPWTGRGDLAGLEITRSASYTFRARLADRFQDGRVFLLGDAAHLTPPFIGQGLAAGLRDADNLAWKLAHVLTGRAGTGLLASYDTERRPHARAMIKKAVRVGWAMTGGQDRAAAVRRIALAAAVRSEHVRQAMASTATPRLKAGALQPVPRLQPDIPAALRPGGLIPNPLVSVGADPPARLDTILARTHRRADRTAARTRARGVLPPPWPRPRPDQRTRNPAPGGPRTQENAGWTEARLADDAPTAGMRALTANPALTILVRPDRVVAAAEPRRRLPRLPWYVPATAGTGSRRPLPRRVTPPPPARCRPSVRTIPCSSPSRCCWPRPASSRRQASCSATPKCGSPPSTSASSGPATGSSESPNWPPPRASWPACGGTHSGSPPQPG